ncbi:MAG: AAA family ATPase [Leptolyngbyaceae cyanobacterium]
MGENMGEFLRSAWVISWVVKSYAAALPYRSSTVMLGNPGMSSQRTSADIEAQVNLEWHWQKIVSDLSKVKAGSITPREKEYFQGLLCYLSPKEIADIRGVTPAAVTKDLYRHIYGLVRQLYADKLSISIEKVRVTYQLVPKLFEEIGYRKSSPGKHLLETQQFDQGFTQDITQRWSGLPEISFFAGRKAELTTLENWIVDQKARLISLTGQGGVGKSTLIAQLGHHLKEQARYLVCWRSLRSFTNPQDLLFELLEFLHSGKPTQSTESLGRLLTQVMQQLQQQRVLIVLDDVHEVLGNELSSNDYSPASLGYVDFFIAMMTTTHHSCLCLISWEEPQTIIRFRDLQPEVKGYILNGLTDSDAYQIVKKLGFQPSIAWDKILELYRCNPLALHLVANEVREIFQGDVNAFLNQNTMFLGDLKYHIHQQLKRLSDHERVVVQGLATFAEPITQADLYPHLASQLRKSELMYALEQLLRRSLLECTEDLGGIPRFALQPMIRKYATVTML